MMPLSITEACASYGKINVTLRVTGRRDDGYHTLHSLFLRTAPLEKLTISSLNGDNVSDILDVTGVKLAGANILQRVLSEVRNNGYEVPSLSLALEKTVPPGTGLGCGSGNAAVLFQWLNRHGWNVDALATHVGADIPFFLQEASLALVSGIGERVEPQTECLDLKVLLIIPKWRCETKTMFRLLDEKGDCHYDSLTAQSEIREVLLRLRQGKQIGLLPNDFEPLLTQMYNEYEHLYRWCGEHGALAWGISGSGSAAFALWRQGKAVPEPTFEWIDSSVIFPTKKESC